MSEISGKPNVLKRLNSILIKNTLKKLGSATKAELAKETGISLTTVGLILNSLIQEEEVINQCYDESSGGRRAERYVINVNHSFAVAMCVEEKHINYAVGNVTGDFIDEGMLAVTDHNFTETVEILLGSLMSKYTSIKCIGIGVPAAVNNGLLYTGVKLKEWHSFNIKAHIEEKYGVQVIMENDLNAMATGFAYNRLKEAELTDSKDLNIVYIYISQDGIGSGIIANGANIRGYSQYAGEISFLQIGNGEAFGEVLNRKHTDEEYANAMAMAIANINCIVNPEYIIIGGEGFEAYNLKRIEEYCSRYIPENIRPEIISSEVPRRDYITGVMYVTIQEMNTRIKLVTT
jgi:Transcriptional regulator/sugar kinase